MFDELVGGSTGGGGFGELLRRRRGGVVAALASACGRLGCCQKEACAALEGALLKMGPWTGMTGVGGDDRTGVATA